MIVQGLKLTMLGMMVVFFFLFLLLIIIYISKKLLGPYSEKESALFNTSRPSRNGTGTPPDHDRKITAIISAAVAAHRARFR